MSSIVLTFVSLRENRHFGAQGTLLLVLLNFAGISAVFLLPFFSFVLLLFLCLHLHATARLRLHAVCI